MVDRPSDSAAFLGAASLGHQISGLFGWVGWSLPTFAHTFALSVLTAACLGGGKRAGLAAGAMWFTIDCGFEIGQHRSIAGYLVPFIPQWFERAPILERTDAYFLSGTFDAWDVVSIAAGAMAAYLMTALPTSGDSDHG
ncbi:MAG: hypothetical protein OEW88_00130 [Gammaproteobacteria bacterium]|nr:hypothetical protein [Gammaproteobacteria bacterium]